MRCRFARSTLLRTGFTRVRLLTARLTARCRLVMAFAVARVRRFIRMVRLAAVAVAGDTIAVGIASWLVAARCAVTVDVSAAFTAFEEAFLPDACTITSATTAAPATTAATATSRALAGGAFGAWRGAYRACST